MMMVVIANRSMSRCCFIAAALRGLFPVSLSHCHVVLLPSFLLAASLVGSQLWFPFLQSILCLEFLLRGLPSSMDGVDSLTRGRLLARSDPFAASSVPFLPYIYFILWFPASAAELLKQCRGRRGCGCLNALLEWAIWCRSCVMDVFVSLYYRLVAPSWLVALCCL